MNDKIIKLEVKYELESGEVRSLEYKNDEWRGTPLSNGIETADKVIQFLEGCK